MRKRWPYLTYLELWCVIWTVNDQVRRRQWAKSMPVIIPGRPAAP